MTLGAMSICGCVGAGRPGVLSFLHDHSRGTIILKCFGLKSLYDLVTF